MAWVALATAPLSIRSAVRRWPSERMVEPAVWRRMAEMYAALIEERR